MRSLLSFLLSITFVGLVSAEVYFKEQFNDPSWVQRWTKSVFKGKTEDEMGEWKWTAGKWYADENDKGVQTSEDTRHYGLIAKLNKPFTNDEKDLVLQFTVKHEQKLDCGGAYLKLLGPDVDEKSFGGDTPYQIMFGPDICGTGTRKTHVIFNYPPKDENLASKSDIKVMTDQLSHLYTLVVRTDNTYEVLIDNNSVKKGNLEDDFNFLLAREIKDPSAKKPSDWVDEKLIPDPEDKKPDDWDDVPALIHDPDAEKPDDWDDEEDGVWEAALIENPEFKGEWQPKMIPNPAYQGEWIHPMIPNPAFVEDKKLYRRCDDCTHIGFELWQVKSGTVFDDIIVTDSLEEAQNFATATFFAKQDKEKEMFEEFEEARRQKEKEEREAMKNKKSDEDDDDDDDDDENDEDEDFEHDEL